MSTEAEKAQERLKLLERARELGMNIVEINARQAPIMVGEGINPGDPRWIPSANFIPPPGFKMPKGWKFEPHLGWCSGVEPSVSAGACAAMATAPATVSSAAPSSER